MLVFALLFEHQAILSRVAVAIDPTAHIRFSRPCANPDPPPPPPSEISQKYRVS